MTTLLQDFAAHSADSRGAALAVAMEDERITYAELERLSDRLAAQFIDAGCLPGDRVGLLIPKRPIAMVAMHAALKAGGVYVPLDAESPPARLGRIVEAADPRLLLAVPEAADRLDALAEIVACRRSGRSRRSRSPASACRASARAPEWDLEAPSPGVSVSADDPAHLLFTSGSTGQPKGVVDHAPQRDRLRRLGRDAFGIGPSDRISGHPPLHFDLSTFDIYATFAAGAELHLVPPSLNLDPHALADFIRERELTQWFSVPSVLDLHGEVRRRRPRTTSRRWSGCCGAARCCRRRCSPTGCGGSRTSASPTSTARPRRRSPAATTRCRAARDETAPIPIGTACDGEELLVLDEELRAVPAGEIGDLYIGGVGLSPGYWRDQEKTAAAFLPDPRAPESGEPHLQDRRPRARRRRRPRPLPRPRRLADQEPRLPHRARRDRDRAQRDRRRPRVRGRRRRDGGLRGRRDLRRLRHRRRARAAGAAQTSSTDALPSYMLPARWLALDALPKNENGKIDRPALREQFARSRPNERRRQRA